MNEENDPVLNYTYRMPILQEVNIVADRKEPKQYMVGYDEDANPIYTTSKERYRLHKEKLEEASNAVPDPLKERRREWKKENVDATGRVRPRVSFPFNLPSPIEMIQQARRNMSKKIMNTIRYVGADLENGQSLNMILTHINEYPTKEDRNLLETYGEDVYTKEGQQGVAQNTYLLSRPEQRKVFEEAGYTYVDNPVQNYGLVNRAVSNYNRVYNTTVPVYSKNKDALPRDSVELVGRLNDIRSGSGDIQTFGLLLGGMDKMLYHSGHFPLNLYINKNNNDLYIQAWDFNNYGDLENYSLGQTSNYNKKLLKAANILDKFGSPVVVTTGLQPIVDKQLTYKLFSHMPINTSMSLDKILRNRGIISDDESSFGFYAY